ncbi:MAG TPA: aminoacetone oxidase family FAD-binding enzyme [Anaerovoracaceae bacterium]|nr:aminoacetone oxidase family FAD-binding enzyme [Anaerovoracaceae bacterium]
MIYDLIIIGAGAAGLFAGASLPSPVNGLIIERKAAPGRKLLMSGSGQCNLTHGGSIKDFISHYGIHGSQIRSILYRFSNLSVIEFFENKGIPLFEREDKKIFPKSLRAQDILNVLTESCIGNGLQFHYSSAVDRITLNRNASNGNSSSPIVYTVHCGDHSYEAKNLIIATGGCSYPATGSDGSFFSVLKETGIEACPLTPALVPVYVQQYPYQNLSGISFQSAEVTIYSGQEIHNKDALLFTHTCFSGPAVLNLSRYAHPGDSISVNYYPIKSKETIHKELSQSVTGNSRQILTVLYEYFNEYLKDSPVQIQKQSDIPKRFLEVICTRAGIDPTEKASRISPSQLKSIIKLITHDEYRIQKLGGYETAMVTAGGVPLTEISTKTMESKKYPNLYFAGEVLDIDGDTGGYNLQFAFSSGFLAARNIVSEKCDLIR